ncbi:MAG: type II secretion system ATPase GspE [bacterium]|nr:type II secretion system ATPase GspE [bacterium]
MVTVWEEKLKNVLLADKIIDQEQWVYANEIKKETAERLDQILLRLSYVKKDQLFNALSKVLNIPYIRLNKEKIDPEVVKKIPANYAYQHRILPMREEDGVLVIAMPDPFDIHLQDEIRLLINSNIKIMVAEEDEIIEAIHEYYGIGAATMEEIIETQVQGRTAEHKVKELKDFEKEARGDEVSIIKFVNQIITDAYKNRATDIHIEPFEKDLRIRYRIDGVLHEIPAPDTIKQFEATIVSRIKIMAELNIAEKRLPQDGRIRLSLEGEEIDIRVSSIPTIWGESIDLRILPRNRVLLGLEQLGVEEDDLKAIEKLIKLPHGIILVTGPTGSGKTTTLYAGLSRINSTDKMIVTVEDPVEYQLKGINQIQVKPKIGLTFAEGLRSILRQDPNIIMVGEIRDPETAEIAIRASLTGHLVFSTLHTNDACGAITRLIDMGIPPYLVSSSVEAALAQRLVRKLCLKCRVKYSLEDELIKELGLKPEDVRHKEIYKASASGCPECNYMGYKGRTGIYELLIIDDEIRRLIVEKEPVSVIKKKAKNMGMRTLSIDGFNKVAQGITSVDEVIRVT